MNISNTLSKVLNLEDYNKSLWENDFLIEKFNSLFKNLITPIIKIDKISKVIEYNENFKTFLKKITSEENYNGFFNNNLADMNTFCFKTMSTIEYIDFYTELEYDSMKSSQASNGAIGFPENNSRHIEEIFLNSVDTNANKDIFFKQLFYLNKILNSFERNINNNEGENKKFYQSIIYEDKYFDTFNSVGNFVVDKFDQDLVTFEMRFRRTKILHAEIVDIMFYETTTITQMEKEKVEAENKYRREYLSLISDKFITPIQVLIHTINEMSDDYKRKKLQKPKKLKEIENLGNYIYSLNQDITSFSRKKDGYDINFENFYIVELFEFGKEILDLFLKYNSTKCYAITTEVIFHPQVPKIVNSDLNRLRQVLVNLLINAYKFTLSGSIKISVTLEESNGTYDEIGVYVEDTGIGVEPYLRDFLFSDTVDSNLENINHDRKGFGLIICRNIIKKIGRKIGYKPLENGSLFFFSFFNSKNEEVDKNVIKYDRKITDILDDSVMNKRLISQSAVIDYKDLDLILEEDRTKQALCSKFDLIKLDKMTTSTVKVKESSLFLNSNGETNLNVETNQRPINYVGNEGLLMHNTDNNIIKQPTKSSSFKNELSSSRNVIIEEKEINNMDDYNCDGDNFDEFYSPVKTSPTNIFEKDNDYNIFLNDSKCKNNKGNNIIIFK